MEVIKIRKEERQKRISKLQNTLKEAFNSGLEIDSNRLVSTACMDWGVSRRTVLEYLQILQNVMCFSWEKNIIKLPAKEGQQKLNET